MNRTRAGAPPENNVLITDDEVEYVRVLSKRLSKRGFEVTTAFSGSEGIRIARQKDFDVALVDLKMEDMDGLEVLKILKKMIPDIAVIILTGHGSADAAREGLKLGASDYLSKPCDLEELIDAIQRVIRHKHVTDCNIQSKHSQVDQSL